MGCYFSVVVVNGNRATDMPRIQSNRNNRVTDSGDAFCVVQTETVRACNGQLVISKDEWRSRMLCFIDDHISDLKEFDKSSLVIAMDRFDRFARGAGFPSKTLHDKRHSNAIQELARILIRPDFDLNINANFRELLNFYYEQGRIEDFEEIAWVFSIIINSVKIRRYDPMWDF